MRITTITAWRLHFKREALTHTKQFVSTHHHPCCCGHLSPWPYVLMGKAEWRKTEMVCHGNLLSYEVRQWGQILALHVNWWLWWPHIALLVFGRCSINMYLQSDEGLGKGMVCLSNLPLYLKTCLSCNYYLDCMEKSHEWLSCAL